MNPTKYIEHEFYINDILMPSDAKISFICDMRDATPTGYGYEYTLYPITYKIYVYSRSVNVYTMIKN
jgi:hypothetical protein